MDGLDKVKKILIVALVVSVAAMLFLMGVSISMRTGMWARIPITAWRRSRPAT